MFENLPVGDPYESGSQLRVDPYENGSLLRVDPYESGSLLRVDPYESGSLLRVEWPRGESVACQRTDYRLS